MCPSSPIGLSGPTSRRPLTAAVANAFATDGRLKVVNPSEADAILEGEIINYQVTVLAFDSNANPQQYRLFVTVSVRFRDVRRGVILFEAARASGARRLSGRARRGRHDRPAGRGHRARAPDHWPATSWRVPSIRSEHRRPGADVAPGSRQAVSPGHRRPAATGRARCTVQTCSSSTTRWPPCPTALCSDPERRHLRSRDPRRARGDDQPRRPVGHDHARHGPQRLVAVRHCQALAIKGRRRAGRLLCPPEPDCLSPAPGRRVPDGLARPQGSLVARRGAGRCHRGPALAARDCPGTVATAAGYGRGHDGERGGRSAPRAVGGRRRRRAARRDAQGRPGRRTAEPVGGRRGGHRRGRRAPGERRLRPHARGGAPDVALAVRTLESLLATEEPMLLLALLTREVRTAWTIREWSRAGRVSSRSRARSDARSQSCRPMPALVDRLPRGARASPVLGGRDAAEVGRGSAGRVDGAGGRPVRALIRALSGALLLLLGVVSHAWPASCPTAWWRARPLWPSFPQPELPSPVMETRRVDCSFRTSSVSTRIAFWFKPSEGTLDPLFARALVLESNGTPGGLGHGGPGGRGSELHARGERASSARPGWRRSRLIISASHTHSGPGAFGDSGTLGLSRPGSLPW